LMVGPQGDCDFAGLPPERLTIAQPHQPQHDQLRARGLKVGPAIEGKDYAGAIVFLPRSRPEALRSIAEATRAVEPGAPVLVDGQKTDGVDSILKLCRDRLAVSGPVVKAHGKLFGFRSAPVFDDWLADDWPMVGKFHTAPGLFSADGIDPASAALAVALPGKLAGHVVDLGAGWGYLADAVLTRPEVITVDLVEADHRAIEAARRNITDPRARFHWADATRWEPSEKADIVVTNPPFHTGREANPALGRAFIATAARILKPRGTLWLVANRHLPYESALAELFREVREMAGTPAFKIIGATRPKSAG
jgi:16S rRNA (guanine1207-N2)-methyltransferase